MEALRQQAQSTFRDKHFYSSHNHHIVVSNTEKEGTLAEDSADLARIETISQSDTQFLMVRVAYNAAASRHAFHTSLADCERLQELFCIDSYGLGMVANDFAGFHCISDGMNKTIASYYLQCAAYKLLWAYNHEQQSVRAIIFTLTSRRGPLAFNNLVDILKMNIKLLPHPLLLPLSAATQTIYFLETLLRNGYDMCRNVELSTGYRPSSRTLGRRDAMIKIAELSQEMTILLRKALMAARRVKQWQIAMAELKRLAIEDDYKRAGVGEVDCKNFQSSSIMGAIKVTQTKLEHLEIEFNHVYARGGNQATAMSQILAREDALTSIKLAMTTTKDSSSMKVIAVMTMLFLPGTFFATLFAVPSLDWKADTVIQGNFWVYVAFALPSTILVLLAWVAFNNRKWVGGLQNAMTNFKSQFGPQSPLNE